MRIALVDPYYVSGSSPPSWVLGQLEALLIEAGHEIILRDFRGRNKDFLSLADFRAHEAAFATSVASIAARCDVVYFTTSFGIPQKPTPILARVKRLLERVNESAPAVPVFIGGAQVEYLTVHGADPYACLGEDARAVSAFLTSDVQLVACVAALDSRAAFDSISGIWLKSGAEGRRVGRPLPWPPGALRKPKCLSWSLDAYPPYRAVLTSLGCRYGCSFCFESKQEFQALDLRRLLGEFTDSGIDRLVIEDSTLLGAHGTDRVVEALRSLPPGGRYTCYALVPEICRSSPDALRLLKKLGLDSVILGIETPDDLTLRRYRKSVSPERAMIAIEKLHDAGITAQGCLMVGIPDVSLDATMYTFEYARELSLDVRRWHIFQPSFDKMPPQIITSEPLWVHRFALSDVNVPDALIPNLIESAPTETLLEEHFLIRALPHMRDAPEALERVRYAAGYSLRDLYGRVLCELRGTQDSFNEEDYYAVLVNDHARPGELRV